MRTRSKTLGAAAALGAAVVAGGTAVARARVKSGLAVVVLCFVAGVLLARPTASNSGPVALAAGKRKLAAEVERNLLECTNLRRKKHGLRPLKLARALRHAARMHARNMVRHRFFGHTDYKGRTASDRVARFNPDIRIRVIGENLAGGQDSAAAACRAWMRSSGHRANILGRYNRIGLGFWSGGEWDRYYVQVFARAG